MGSAMAQNALKAWIPNSFEEEVEIKFKTKYFSTKRDAHTCMNVPFHPMVDPNDVLKSQLSEEVRHGVENEVIYKKLTIDEEDASRM